MKQIKGILIWAILFGYLLLSFSFVNRKQNERNLHTLKVQVKDSIDRGFVTNRDVEDMINKLYPNWKGNKKNFILKENLEKEINEIPYVKNSEVYCSLTGKLFVEIYQREPIVRVLKKEGYYLDCQGEKMPLSPRFTSKVLIVSGAVNEQLIKNELLGLIQFIVADEFWESQITQIHVNKTGEYTLIPKVGNHKIELGGIDNYRKKFKKLHALYTEGFKRTGWNKYSKINLRYKNQVVCTKK